MKMWRWLVYDRVTFILFALNVALMAWVAHLYLTKAGVRTIEKPVTQAAASLAEKSPAPAVLFGSTGKSAIRGIAAAAHTISPPQKIQAKRLVAKSKRSIEAKFRNYILLSSLSGEDLEQVLDLLAARMNTKAAAERLMVDEALSKMVGESGIALIDYHLHTQILRGQLEQLEAVLAPGPSPLSPRQVEQLIALWCAKSELPANGEDPQPRLPNKIDEPSLNAAARFLDQAQLAALQRFAAAREAVAAMSAAQSAKAHP